MSAGAPAIRVSLRVLLGWILAVAALCAVAILAVASAKSFQDCMMVSSGSAIGGRLMPCIGEFLDSNESVVTAISTLVVAIFTAVLAISTIGLWRATNRLVSSADVELKRMVDGIDATLSVASETKLVAAAMAEAASAMRQSASISEAAMKSVQQNTERELRAYLAVEPAGINQLIGKFEGIGHVTVRNVGKIPAHNVTVRVHTRLSGDLNEKMLVDKDDRRAERSIQPGAQMRRGSDEPQPVDQLCNPGKYVFVWGVVYYDDGYGNRRFTNFCHRYETASYNRNEDWNSVARTSRAIIGPDKARYHHTGNDSN